MLPTDSASGSGTNENRSRQRRFAIAGLTAFALTQPIFDILSHSGADSSMHRLELPEVIGLVVVLAVILPALAILADAAVGWLAARIGGRGRNLALGLLAVAATLAILRPLPTLKYFRDHHATWIPSTVLALVVGVAMAVEFDRRRSLRQWLSLTAVGLILFPTTFAVRYLRATSASREQAPRIATTVKSPAPVILIVFDEFSGTTLMNDALEIDADQFPQIAKLAASSTWYPKATSVHARTPMAVPAILSGQLPGPDQSLDAANYPGNLIERLEQSGVYDVSSYEPFSNFCSQELERSQGVKRLAVRFTRLLQQLAAVYPRLLLPDDAPISLAAVPLAISGEFDEVDLTQARTGRLVHGGFSQRIAQLDHLLGALEPVRRPRLWFVHALVPHYPWCYLPSGHEYQNENNAPGRPLAAVGAMGEDWPDDATAVLRNEFRYRMQVGYIDHFLGRLQDRLKEEGLWDSCLLIVTADHGVSFRPGHSRRVPDQDNLADLMSVPLFIKFPGQAEGRVDRRNVETIDIFPTIAEVLGIAPDERWDGQSLLRPGERPRKTFGFDGSMTVVEPEFPQLAAAVARHRTVFGGRPLGELPPEACARPDWQGRSISDARIEDRPYDSLRVRTQAPDSYLPDPWRLVPCLVEGEIGIDEVPDGAVLVAALNGVVVDSCRLHETEFQKMGFELLLPESQVVEEGQRVELFLMGDDSQPWQRIHSFTTPPAKRGLLPGS